MKILSVVILDQPERSNHDPVVESIVSVLAFTSVRTAYTSLFNGWTQEAAMDCDCAESEEEHAELLAGYEENKAALAKFLADNPDFEESLWFCENEGLWYRFEWTELDE